MIAVFFPIQPAAAADPGVLVVGLNSSHMSAVLNYYGNAERLFEQVYRVRVADRGAALAAFQADPAVRFAEPERIVRTEAVTNDSVFTVDPTEILKQWYLPKMEVQHAWDKTKGGNVTVAIVDTGINGRHEDLGDGRVIAGYLQYCQAVTIARDCSLRFSGDIGASVNSDDNGHGTIVAGLIGAIPNNARGIAGINWTVRLMPIKSLDAQGTGLASDVAGGMHWAVDHGANIINLSIGGPGLIGVEVLQEAITYAYNHGVLVVAAAGNDAAVTGGNLNIEPSLPVCADGGGNMVIGVAALDIADRKAGFSNYGSNCVDLAAPGTGTFVDRQEKQGIISTYYDPARPGENDLYVRALGTSVAAPLVSGVAALMISVFPDLALPQLRIRLLASVDNVDAFNTFGCEGSCAGQIGSGRINAFKAVNAPPVFAAGTLLRGSDGRIYLIETGTKRPVSDFVFTQRFSGAPLTQTTLAELGAYPTSLPLPPADGTLVKSPDSPLVYLVEAGTLLPLSYLAFTSRSFRFENIVTLPAGEIQGYKTGEPVLVANGALVKSQGQPAVYVLQSGVRQMLSYFVYKQRGFDQLVVGAISDEELARYPLQQFGFLYPPHENTLLRGDQTPTVYVIEDGRRRGLNLAAFQARGYSFANVHTLPQSEVNGYEQGTNIIQ